MNLLLVHSPLVGPSTWSRLAELARSQGSAVALPDLPDGWVEKPCGYLQLSPAYDVDAATAAAHDWPTKTVDRTHLSIFTEPTIVLDAIEALVTRLPARS